MKFNENLKKMRQKSELTQKELADKIGKTLSALQHYEHGLREPDLITLKQIKEILCCSYEDLLD